MAMLAEVGMLPSEPQLTLLMDANRHNFEESLSRETFLAWLAEGQGKTLAIGGVLLFRRPPTGENMTGLDGYVMNMYTLSEWRGRGIASRLLQIITAEMCLCHVGRLWLHATPIGRPIYETCGFTLVNPGLAPEATIEMKMRL
jgi:GNAT superfamily N-acetyltransferase